jgi:drug/metabolite transporter (DMT)-like permease
LSKIPLPRSRLEWGVAILFGLPNSAVPFILIAWATLSVPSGTAGLMMASTPIIVMLISIFALPEERATFLRITGLLVGFSGVAMVFLGRDAATVGTVELSASANSVLPYIALLGGTTCYAISGILGRKYRDIPVMSKSLGALIAASVFALGAAYLLEPLPIAVTLSSAVSLLYLAIAPTALAMILVLWLLKRSSAGFVAQVNYAVPVVAVIFGAVALSAQLGWMQYLGMITILAGIAITERIWKRREKTVTTPPA